MGAGLVDEERGLLRDDFEDGAGVGHVDKSVGAEHEAQQAAVPAVVGDALCSQLGEISSRQNQAANLAEVIIHEEKIIAVGHGVDG